MLLRIMRDAISFITLAAAAVFTLSTPSMPCDGSLRDASVDFKMTV